MPTQAHMGSSGFSERVRRVFAPFRQLTLRFWITFLAATLVVEGGERLFERAVHDGHSSPVFVRSLFSLSGLYQRVVNAPRPPVIRAVTIVEIDPKRDIPGISASNVCLEREFLSRLLKRIDEAGPTVIAVDKYFGRDTCEEGHAGTAELQQAVADVRQRRALVVGLRTSPLSDDGHGAGPTQSAIEPSLEFSDGGRTHQEGVINIAADNRRLPLQWLLYETSPGKTGNPVVRDTFALSIAQAYDPQFLPRRPWLEKILSRGEHPFIGFLDEHAFEGSRYYASQVLCGRRLAVAESWRTCTPGALPPGLSKGVVLIAENDPDRDEHLTIVGTVPGFILQANYVEALLDDRYYRSAGPVLNVGLALLFMLGLELILIVYHHHVRTAIFFVLGLVVVTYAIIYVVIVHVNWYLDPSIGVTAVVLKTLHVVYGYARTGAHGENRHAEAV